MDPLGEEFEDWSPYSYVYNNPLSYIDPDGMAAAGWSNPADGIDLKQIDIVGHKKVVHGG